MLEDTPYIEQQPGNLITSEIWNELQRLIKADIRGKVEEGVAGIDSVAQAGDAEKLGGQSAEELAEEIVRRAVAAIRAQSGYMKLFLRLKVDELRVIPHGLGVCPLVDAYQLDYFPVVCCEDEDTYPAWASFYAYHSSENKIRYTTADGQKGSMEIQAKNAPAWRVPFREILARYQVAYTGTSALSDVLTELWKALFSEPNDEFDDNQYCHSPWFDKCCREEMSIKKIKQKGHWDDIWIKWQPCRTINYPGVDTTALVTPGPEPPPVLWGNYVGPINLETAATAVLYPSFLPEPPPPSPPYYGRTPGAEPDRADRAGDSSSSSVENGGCPTPAPTQIQVCQFDYDTLGVTLLNRPVYSPELFAPDQNEFPGLPRLDQQIEDVRNELKLMLLLKC